MMSLIFYFVLSGWIANLGVVPLLLFAAFLFVPIFTFFAALLFLVTRVLETIFYLLLPTSTVCFARIKYSNLKYLQELLLLVKVSSFLVAAPSKIFAETTYFQEDSISMSRGEVREIQINGLHKYTVGNKQVLGLKGRKDTLLIKAKSIGVSDLVIWSNHHRSGKTIKVFVLNKKSALNAQYWIQHFKKTHIMAKSIRNTLELSGVIKSYSQYLTVKSLIKEYPHFIITAKLTVEKKLQHQLYTKLIHDGLTLYQDDLDCIPLKLYIQCYEINNKKNHHFLSQKYFITWIPKQEKNSSKQFRATVKLFQYENLKGQNFSLGLDKINIPLKKILNKNPLALVQNNSIHLQKSDYTFSTLAHPTVVGRLGKDIVIKLGTEVSFNQVQRDGLSSTQWKFAGLKINLKINEHHDYYIVEYESSLGQPMPGQTIQMNQQKSSLMVTKGKPHLMFEVGFQTGSLTKDKVPIVEFVPILKELFSSRHKHNTFKKIIGIINIEEISHES